MEDRTGCLFRRSARRMRIDGAVGCRMPCFAVVLIVRGFYVDVGQHQSGARGRRVGEVAVHVGGGHYLQLRRGVAWGIRHLCWCVMLGGRLISYGSGNVVQ